MRVHPVLFALFGLAPTTTACVRETNREATVPSAQDDDGPWNAPAESREVLVAEEPAQAADPEAEPASPVAPLVSAKPAMMRPEPVLFRLGAGYGVLGRLDLST
ncbi:MAG: hypothetical protein JOZ69_12940, partial [Myxococcales bacterium]|nr:hypothetical protein [Myxococcales bacterium]